MLPEVLPAGRRPAADMTGFGGGTGEIGGIGGVRFGHGQEQWSGINRETVIVALAWQAGLVRIVRLGKRELYHFADIMLWQVP